MFIRVIFSIIIIFIISSVSLFYIVLLLSALSLLVRINLGDPIGLWSCGLSLAQHLSSNRFLRQQFGITCLDFLELLSTLEQGGILSVGARTALEPLGPGPPEPPSLKKLWLIWIARWKCLCLTFWFAGNGGASTINKHCYSGG